MANKGGVLFMVVITKKKGKTKEAMFREFTRTFIDENVIEDVRSRMFYKKPSLVRKEKEKERGKTRFTRTPRPRQSVR